MVETVEKFIEFINKNDKYMKIFKNSIFSVSNIELTISFFDQNMNRSHKEDDVAFVYLSNGKLFYYYEPDPEKNCVLKKVEIESYEQAHTIVMQEKLSSQEVQKD